MTDFWQQLERLIATSRIVIDRPRGTAHPRFPAVVYPLDYGYLDGTTTVDGGGVDLWRGASGASTLVGVICTADLLKRDAEIKLLLGCTPDEIHTALDFHNGASQRALLVPRPHAPENKTPGADR